MARFACHVVYGKRQRQPEVQPRFFETIPKTFFARFSVRNEMPSADASDSTVLADVSPLWHSSFTKNNFARYRAAPSPPHSHGTNHDALSPLGTLNKSPGSRKTPPKNPHPIDMTFIFPVNPFQ